MAKKRLKKTGVIVLLAGILSAWLFIELSNAYIKRILLHRFLPDYIAFETKGNFSLSIEDADISFLKQSIHIKGLSASGFQPEKSTNDTMKSILFQVELKNIYLRDFNLFPFLLHHRLQFRSIEADSPILRVWKPGSDELTEISDRDKSSRNEKYLPVVVVDSFQLTDGRFDYYNSDSSVMPEYAISNIQFTGSRLTYDPYHKKKVQYMDSDVFVEDVRAKLSGEEGETRIHQLRYSSTDSILQVDSFRIDLKPTSPHGSGIILIPGIIVTGVVLKDWVNNKALGGKKLLVKDPFIELNAVPGSSVKKNMPHSGMKRNFDIKILFDSVVVENGKIHFSDRHDLLFKVNEADLIHGRLSFQTGNYPVEVDRDAIVKMRKLEFIMDSISGFHADSFLYDGSAGSISLMDSRLHLNKLPLNDTVIAYGVLSASMIGCKGFSLEQLWGTDSIFLNAFILDSPVLHVDLVKQLASNISGSSQPPHNHKGSDKKLGIGEILISKGFLRLHSHIHDSQVADTIIGSFDVKVSSPFFLPVKAQGFTEMIINSDVEVSFGNIIVERPRTFQATSHALIIKSNPNDVKLIFPEIRFEKNLDNVLFSIKANEVFLEGINVKSFMNKSIPVIKRLLVKEPDVLFSKIAEGNNEDISVKMSQYRGFDPGVIHSGNDNQPGRSIRNTSKGLLLPDSLSIGSVLIHNGIMQYFQVLNGMDTTNITSRYNIWIGDLMIDHHRSLQGEIPVRGSAEINFSDISVLAGHNNFTVKDLEYSSSTSVLSVKDFSFLQHNGLPGSPGLKLRTIKLPGVEINELDLFEVVNTRKLITGPIFIRKPETCLIYDHSVQFADKGNASDTLHPGRLLKYEFAIENFTITDGSITMIERENEKEAFVHVLDSFRVQFEGVRNDEMAKDNMTGSIKFNDLNFYLPSFSSVTKDSLYTVGFGSVSLQSLYAPLTIDSFYVSPNYSRYDFSRKLGYQTDRMKVYAGRLIFMGIDPTLLLNGDLDIDKIILNDFSLEGFRDKRVEFPAWQRRSLPVSMLNSLKFPLSIDTVLIEDGYVKYLEQVEGSRYPGDVFFTDMDVSVFNITNRLSGRINDTSMRVDFTGKLMGEGRLVSEMFFPLNSTNDTFLLRAELEHMDLTIFSEMTRNLFGVEISKGTGSANILHLNGNNDYAHGFMEFPYDKLRISLYNREKGKKRGVSSEILAFLANELVIKSNNPRIFRKLKLGEMYTERNKQKSVFNFIWKATLTGIESSLGFENKALRYYRKTSKHNKE